MSSKTRRPISLTDVVFGSTGFPLLLVGIFYGLDRWLVSSALLVYPANLSGIIFIVPGVALAAWCFKVARAPPAEPILVTWGP